MLKLEFTNEEINRIKSKIHFTPIQERIINYRLDEYSITKMAMDCEDEEMKNKYMSVSNTLFELFMKEHNNMKNIFSE